MESRKIRIMPYIFVCGIAILNLLLMTLPFLRLQHLVGTSGYVLISALEGATGFFIGSIQVIIMLLLFFMLIYGAIGILYACGISGVDMSSRKFRLFCAFPIVVLDILYFVQFIFIIVYASVYRCSIDLGIYMSFFLNISITIVYSALIKTPNNKNIQVKNVNKPVDFDE